MTSDNCLDNEMAPPAVSPNDVSNDGKVDKTSLIRASVGVVELDEDEAEGGPQDAGSSRIIMV